MLHSHSTGGGTQLRGGRKVERLTNMHVHVYKHFYTHTHTHKYANTDAESGEQSSWRLCSACAISLLAAASRFFERKSQRGLSGMKKMASSCTDAGTSENPADVKEQRVLSNKA